MRKIKILLFAAAFTVFGAGAFAADATVTFVSGKVEVQRNGKWIALQKGDTVSKSETISTGFQSEAKIKILDSVMYLGPVTRITLEELSSTSQKDNVNVYLKTGTARSQVKHVDNKRVNYQVHTAVAVASCRGTEWIIDDSNNIDCFEGVVAVTAYVDPAIENAKKGEGEESDSEIEADENADEIAEEKADEKADEKTDGRTEEKTDEIADEKIESKTEEKIVETERDVPTSADGVLVKANQTVSVSDTSTVSAPVNTVVKTATEVTTNVSTAASKESEGGASGVKGADMPVGPAAGPVKPRTANVIANLEFPDY